MNKIMKALAVTAEVCGTEFSEPAAIAVVSKLSEYNEGAVLKALELCMTELTGRLTLAAIISRIDDGRPGADEAWSIALSSMDEVTTVIWNNEICEAYGIAQPIFNSGDEIGARMAFRSAYDRIVQGNRAAGKKPQWLPSRGTDKALAETVINQAVAIGRLTREQALNALPYSGTTVEGFVNTLAIESKGDGASREYALDALDKIKQMLGK